MLALVRRLGLYALAAWASLTLNFALPRMMSGDPAAALMARFRGQIEPSALAALRETFGYTDAPWWSQYATYLRHVLSGDLGRSIAYHPASVAEVIGTGLGFTLALAGTSVIVSFALGTLLGALAAWKRGSWLDTVLPPAFSFVAAFPFFWLAMLVLYALGFKLAWFPLRHAYSAELSPAFDLAFVLDVARHAVLPVSTIVLATMGGWMLAMRNNMVAVLGTEPITYAHAKGLAPSRVLLHYAARGALLPSITAFGMALGFAVSGSLLTEIVFSYPGTGYLLVQAVRNQDQPLMQGLFLVITLAVLGTNLLVDVVYVALDPRTRRHG